MNVKILIEKLNESLVRVLNELTVLHDAALSTVEATTQDELIEEVTTIVGKALFPTNFGILMLDESSHTITTHPSYRFMEGKQIWNLKVGEGITGQVAKTGKTLRVGDVRKNPYYLESDSRIRSELCVPIKAGKRVIGLINSEHTKHDAFTKDDQRLLSTIAGQIGPALDRLRAEESLRRQFNELAVIHSISTACVEEKEQDKLIDRATQIIGETLYPTNFGIMLVNEESHTLRTHPSYRLWEGEEAILLSLDEGITGKVVKTGKPMLVPDVQKEPLYVQGDSRSHSELCVPLKLGDHVIGVINTEHNQPGFFTKDDERLLLTFAGQLAPSIERLRTEESIRRQFNELAVIHSISTACVEEIKQDKLIDRATQIIGETLYPTNFGIMLVNEESRTLITHPSYRLWEGEEAILLSLDEGITGHVIKTGKPMLVPDVQKEPLYVQGDSRTHSELCVPLKLGERVIGVINTEHDQPGFFTKDDERLLLTFAGQLAPSIERLRTEESIHRQFNELAVIHSISTACVEEKEQDKLIDRATQIIGETLYPTNFGIMLVNEESHTLRTHPSYRLWEGEEAILLSLDEGITGHVVKTGKPMLVPDVQKEPLYVQGDSRSHSELCVPLKLGERVIGVINTEHNQPGFFTKDDERLLLTFAGQLAPSIERLRTEESIRRQFNELAVIHSISTACVEEKEQDKLIDRATQIIGETLYPTNFGIMLVNEESHTLRTHPSYRLREGEEAIILSMDEGITGHVVKTGKPMLVPDVQKEPLYVQGDSRSHSELCVPLKLGERVIGVINTEHNQPGFFTKDDERLLLTFAGQLALSLERLKSEESIHRQFNELAVIHSISTTCVEEKEQDKLIDRATQIIGETLYPTNFGIMLVNEESHTLRTHPSYRLREGEEAIILSMDEGITGKVVKTGKPMLVPDVQKEPLYVQGDSRSHSELCVPLKLGERVIGVINTEHNQPGFFTKDDERLLLTFAGQLALSLERLKSEESIHRQFNELAVIQSFSTACVEEKEQDKLIDRATQIIGETLYPTNFGIMLVNEESHTLRTHPSYRLREGEEAIILSLDEGITGHVVKTGKPMLVPDVQKEPLYVPGDSRTHSELCVPLKLGERVIGVINTEHNQPGFFTKDDERLLLTFAGQLAPAIERLRAEEKLITEKERLSVTLRSIGEGVITIDTQGNVILLNRVAEEMTGWLQEKAAGQLLQIVFKAEGIESCIKSQYPLLDEIKRSMFLELKSDIKLISSDGSVKIIDFSSAPLRDEKSQIIGFVLVFRDITDKLKLENEAQKAQKLEAIGILAGGIAHDFNNILAVMMGNIELAKLEGKLEEKIYERLNQAERAIERATGLTKQLLTFSKGGAPVKEITSIKTIIKESVDFILSGSNIGCKFFFGEDLWSVEVDIGQINQVINNLILNAMQSMLNGGVINVAVKNIRIKKNEQSPLTPGDYVNITIKDSGVGIPEENIDKVFDPYFTTKIGGSGLGLTTTYAIIKKHGGSIHVESVEGIGTEIHIYLPAIRQKAIIPKKVTSEIVKGTGKVLFMDDEVTITQVVEDFLIGIGYKVTIAHNGDEAIDYFDRSNKEGKPYGLVILDLTIPGGIGGKEVIKRLRVIDPKIRAIATSGYSNDPVMAKYNEHGFNDILPKPFKINELARIVKKYT